MASSATSKKKSGLTANPQKQEKTKSKKNIDTLAPSGEQTVPKKRVFPWEPIAVCVLLFIFLFVQGIGGKYDIHLGFALGAVAIFIFSFIKASNRRLLLEKISPIFLFAFAQSILFFAGLFYGSYPKFALQQFFLNFGGLFIFVSMYLYFLRDEKNVGRFLILFSTCVAIVSLVCIELATSRSLLVIFQQTAALIGGNLPGGFASFETNTRIVTVLGNPNVFAPIAVFGMFAALWGCGIAGSHKKRDVLLMGLAIICGTTFILCFSLGTILAFIPALVALILTSKKEERGSVLFSNAYCLFISLVLAFIVFAFRNKSFLPVFSVLLLSLGAALIYINLKPISLPKSNINNKIAKVVIALSVCAVFLICAFIFHSSYTLSKGGTFKRAVALSPGKYTINVTLADPASTISTEIYSMSYADAALKEKTEIKTIDLRSGASTEFIVPESSAAVFFSFSAGSDIRVESVKVSGSGITKQLPLRYLLLPEFIVNRLQGIWVNDNAIQRFIFFRDGIRLGMTSPIIGLGGGAFEGGLYSVSDYKYQTKHAHNEYIQNFIDGGILGLLIFLALTFCVYKALYKAGKTKKIPSLLPFLSGSMLLVFLHAMLEVDFSMPAYKLTASVLFALTAASCDDFVDGGSVLKNIVKIAFPLTWAVTVILMAGRIYAVSLTSSNVSIESLPKAAVFDPFDANDYKLSYLLHTANNTSTSASSQRQIYLNQLENKKIDSDSKYMLAYYYLMKAKPEVEKGIKLSESYIRERRVDPDSWDKIFLIYDAVLNSSKEKTADSMKINESVRTLCSYLTELNRTLPKAIKPALADYMYMRTDTGVQEKQLVADSRLKCDLDQDGISDIVNSRSGDSIEWKINIVLPANVPYTIKVYQKNTAKCEIHLDSQQKVCEYDSAKGCFKTRVFTNSTAIVTLIIKTDKYTEDTYFTVEKYAN